MKITAKTALAAGLALAGGILAPGAGLEARAAAEHRVRQGDNLHLIAGYYYKDPRQWKRIHAANRKAVRHASRIRPGQVLVIEAEPGKGWDIPYEEFVARAGRK